MPVDSHIVGYGARVAADVMSRNNRNGLAVFTEPMVFLQPTQVAFVNPTYGAAMNQNIAFGGSPELMFDGGSGGTEWTGTALNGTWNFADTGKVTITSANNGDSARFDDAGTIATSGYSAVTGKIDLDTFNPASHAINMQFGLAGVLVGDAIVLSDYIDTADFTEQSFAIDMSEFNLLGATVDEVTITIVRGGGSKPTIKFDDFQIEQIGGTAIYTVAPVDGEIYYPSSMRIDFVDNVTGAAAKSYNKILGVSALTNGLTFTLHRKQKTDFTAVLRNLSDFLFVGFVIDNEIDDGTNTQLTLNLTFAHDIELDARRGDYISWTVADDLSGLVQFRSILRGRRQGIKKEV